MKRTKQQVPAFAPDAVPGLHMVNLQLHGTLILFHLRLTGGNIIVSISFLDGITTNIGVLVLPKNS